MSEPTTSQAFGTEQFGPLPPLEQASVAATYGVEGHIEDGPVGAGSLAEQLAFYEEAFKQPNYIPSVAGLDALQAVRRQITPQKSVEGWVLGYFDSKGIRIEESLAHRIFMLADPGSWVQDKATQDIFWTRAHHLDHPKLVHVDRGKRRQFEKNAELVAGLAETKAGTLTGVIVDSRLLVAKPKELTSADYSRLIELSQASRRQLELMNVDVDALLAWKNERRFSGRVTVEQLKEMDVDVGEMPQSVGRAAVYKTVVIDGKAVKQRDSFSLPPMVSIEAPDDLDQEERDYYHTVGFSQLLAHKFHGQLVNEDNVESLILSLTVGGTTKINDMGDSVRISKPLSQARLEQISEAKQHFADFDVLESNILVGGEVPSEAQIAAKLFQGKKPKELTSAEQHAVYVAHARLTYTKSTHAKVDKRAAKLDGERYMKALIEAGLFQVPRQAVPVRLAMAAAGGLVRAIKSMRKRPEWRGADALVYSRTNEYLAEDETRVILV